MEVVRYKYIFIALVFITTHISSENAHTKTKSTHKSATCPYSKIIEDIFKVNNKSFHTPMSYSERAKLFLHSIAKVTESNEEVSQEELVNDIIAAINRIKNNITKENSTESRLNEAIILLPKDNITDDNDNKKTLIQIVSGIEDKIDATKPHSLFEKQHSNFNFTKTNVNKIMTDSATEKTNYVEVLTIEPNNTHKNNVSTHDIIEVLKHLMPMFNSTLTKELHNITIIERNFNKNHSFSATKNVSTIVVTYCDKDNSSNTNITLESGKETNSKKPSIKHDEEYDYYDDAEETNENDEQEEVDMTFGEKKDILEAAEYGMQKMHELYSVLEPKLYSMGLWLDDTNPARYVAAFNAPSEDSARFTRYGYASLQASTKLKELIRKYSSGNLINMKLIVALSIVFLAVSAMPTEIETEEIPYNDHLDLEIEKDYGIELYNDVSEPLAEFDNEADVFNATLDARMERQKGFSSFGGGTRGGTGGAVWTVWDAFALRDAVAGNDRRIVNVRGRIDLIVLFTGSPGVRLRVGNYKSIIGVDRNAEILGGGLSISGNRQVIIQNLRITNALNFAPGERPNGNGGIISQVPGPFSTVDSIGIERAHHVWVDHCELSDDPWNAATLPDNRRRHDGLIDITQGADLVSVSNTIFRNHNMVSLVGNDDNNAAMDRGRLRTTFYQNWFRGTIQRNPRVRFGQVHVLNNLYTDVRSYAIGVGAGARIYVERNVFINTRRSWGFAAGTPNPMGNLAHLNNNFHNSFTDSGIPSNIGWHPDSYYQGRPMGVAQVEAYVRRNAGPR